MCWAWWCGFKASEMCEFFTVFELSSLSRHYNYRHSIYCFRQTWIHDFEFQWIFHLYIMRKEVVRGPAYLWTWSTKVVKDVHLFPHPAVGGHLQSNQCMLRKLGDKQHQISLGYYCIIIIDFTYKHRLIINQQLSSTRIWGLWLGHWGRVWGLHVDVKLHRIERERESALQ